MVLFADQVKLFSCLLMAREAVHAEAVVYVLETALINFAAVRLTSIAKNSQSRVVGLNPFFCLIMTSVGTNCTTEPSG